MVSFQCLGVEHSIMATAPLFRNKMIGCKEFFQIGTKAIVINRYQRQAQKKNK